MISGIKIPWQVFACAGLALVLGFSHWKAYDKGRDGVQEKWDASVARGQAIVDGMKGRQKTLTEKVEALTAAKVVTIREKGDVIVKQVKVFVPDDSCTLSGGFRLFHDAAATNTLPDATRANDAEPVQAQTLAVGVAENYTTCNAAIADLEGLREWVKEQEKLYLDQCKEEPALCSKDK